MINIKHSFSFSKDLYEFSIKSFSDKLNESIVFKAEKKNGTEYYEPAFFHITRGLLNRMSYEQLRNFLYLSADARFATKTLNSNSKIEIKHTSSYNYYDLSIVMRNVAMQHTPNNSTRFQIGFLYSYSDFQKNHLNTKLYYFKSYWAKIQQILKNNEDVIKNYDYEIVVIYCAIKISMFDSNIMKTEFAAKAFDDHLESVKQRVEETPLIVRETIYFVSRIENIRSEIESLDENKKVSISPITKKMFSEHSDFSIYELLLKRKSLKPSSKGLKEWMEKATIDELALAIVFGFHSVRNKRRSDEMLKLINNYPEIVLSSSSISTTVNPNLKIFSGVFIESISKEYNLTINLEEKNEFYTKNMALDSYFSSITSSRQLSSLQKRRYLVNNESEINYVIALLINNLGVSRFLEIFEEIRDKWMFPDKEDAPTYSIWKQYVNGYESKGYEKLPLDWALGLTTKSTG